VNGWSFNGSVRGGQLVSCSCPSSTERRWGDYWPWKSFGTSSKQTLRPESHCTLTDHKPALFENSLSNKGQLSAWKLAEVSDLLSIVKNLYRQGGKMLFADILSRIYCGPTEGWHDPALPSKIATLLRYLPEEIRETQKIRLYAGKGTGGVSKILYQWRKKKGLLASSIVSGKLPSTTEAQDAFHIGVEDVNKVVNQCRNLIANGKQFDVLVPVSIAGEVARLENSGGDRHYDDELLKKVEGLSRIILAQDAEMWLLNLTNHRINEFVPVHQQGQTMFKARRPFSGHLTSSRITRQTS
jgi:hypothetical protein